jgi:hypothetical protein
MRQTPNIQLQLRTRAAQHIITRTPKNTLESLMPAKPSTQ